MKKNIFFIFIGSMFCSFAVFAVNGPYVGLEAGYSNVIFNRDKIATVGVGDDAASSWEKTNVSAYGFQGQIVAGYSYDVNKLRLGGEIVAQGPMIRYTRENSEGSHTNYSLAYAYGANLASGYYINDSSLFYLKLGIMRGRFAFKDVYVEDVIPTCYGTSSSIEFFDNSFSAWGMNFGLGTEMYLTKNIGLKLEYLYTRYAEKKLTSTVSATAYPTTTAEYIRPQVHTVMLGLDYQFNL